ncbi:MAG TPA: hypothetical protein DC054_20195 [Blastocatellia bacterium]|nr:hypothetical protein [Blastocatellia bacterium]
MPRPKCPPEEDIVRALHDAQWDRANDRKSSTIFKGKNISVSRLSVLGLRELFGIFHAKLDGSPNGAIVAVGEINVGELQRIGRQYQHPMELTVEEDPQEDNLAHAVIPQDITRGLANVIIKTLKIHNEVGVN